MHRKTSQIRRAIPEEILARKDAENCVEFVDDASYVKFNAPFMRVEVRNKKRQFLCSIQPQNIEWVDFISPASVAVYNYECPVGFREVALLIFKTYEEADIAGKLIVALRDKYKLPCRGTKYI